MPHPTFPLFPTTPLLSELPFLNLPSLSPLFSSSPTSSTDLGETKNRKPDQDRLEKPEILAAAFWEKPVPEQGEQAIIYSPLTKAELRDLTKYFINLLQDSVQLVKKFYLIVRMHDPDYSDLVQLIHLLISESKAAEWLGKFCWETPIEELLKQREIDKEKCKELAHQLH